MDVELSSSDTSTVTGEAVNFSATVGAQAPGGGMPNGTVQLRVDGSRRRRPGRPGRWYGRLPGPSTSLGAGNHTVAAVYSGSSNYDGGQDSLTQIVDEGGHLRLVLATPSPAVEGQGVTLTARVGAVAPGSGAPTGTVSFTANGDPLGAAPLQAVLRWRRGDHRHLRPGAGHVHDRGDLRRRRRLQRQRSSPITPHGDRGGGDRRDHDRGDVVAEPVDVRRADHVHRERDAQPTAPRPSGTVQFSVDGADFGDPVQVGSDGTAESATLASPDPGDHTVIAAFTPATGLLRQR